ncbi:MAG: hypothetical protein CV087_00150 [Candidatus Brocadia sp. WS118]|nr:MAG: hypothetical protein CV087_00150 [Candidatus Brocadia sp. WS118]
MPKALVISHFDAHYITVFLGNGNGSFVKKENIDITGSRLSVLIEDINFERGDIDQKVEQIYYFSQYILNPKSKEEEKL